MGLSPNSIANRQISSKQTATFVEVPINRDHAPDTRRVAGQSFTADADGPQPPNIAMQLRNRVASFFSDMRDFVKGKYQAHFANRTPGERPGTSRGVGQDRIAAYKAEQDQIAAELARVKRPEIDVSKAVRPLVTITGTPLTGQTFEVSNVYLRGKHGNAIVGMTGERRLFDELPTESDFFYAAMLGTDTPPNSEYLDAVLADPELKAAIKVFLHDGGVFRTVLLGDKMEYLPDENVIEVPNDIARHDGAKMERAA